MASEVERYYDTFSDGFIDDIVCGNERIDQQLIFLSRAIAPTTHRVLVIGCGAGQSVHFIADRVATSARVLGVDLSAKSLELARALFAHSRVEYRKLDVTVDPLEGLWDAIVLPDVYEHIPIASRKALHETLSRVLSPRGKILLTVPSPGKQASLLAQGEGLQVIDEVVTQEDLRQVARDIGGALTYFNMISVWETNDYMHAVVEREADRVRPIGNDDRVALKGWPPRSVLDRGLDFLTTRLRLTGVRQSRTRRKVQSILGRGVQSGRLP